MQKDKQGLFEVHLAVLLFGFAGLFGKFLLLPSLIIVLGRTVFGSIALFATLRWRQVRVHIPERKSKYMLMLLGVVLAVHWVTFFHAIQVSTVAIGALTYSTFPLWVTFMEPLMFREKLRAFDVLTAMLVLLGLILIVPSFDFSNDITRGAFWGTISGLAFALLTMLNRKYVQSYPHLIIAYYQNVFAALSLLPFSFFVAWSLTMQDFWLLLLLGVVCTAFSHALYIKSLNYLKTQLVSIIASLEPVYGIVLAYLILQEVPSLRTLLGGAIILGTTLLAVRKR